jgi:DNA repair protein RadC
MAVHWEEDPSRLIEGLNFEDSDQTAEYIRQRIGPVMNEHFVVLAFTHQKEYIGDSILNTGNGDVTLVDSAGLMRLALLSGGNRFIVGHNHPGDDVQPSKADVLLTVSILMGLTNFSLMLVDHIIVNDKAGQYFSFRRDMPQVFGGS